NHFLRALRDHRYPTVISTRSPLVATHKYIDILKRMSVVVQFSLSTLDDKKASLFEPLAPAAARSACHRSGVAFGAADNDFQYFSDGDACCSSVDVVAGFSTTYHYTIAHIIKSQITRSAEIYFNDGASWRPRGPVDRFLNSKSRMTKREHDPG